MNVRKTEYGDFPIGREDIREQQCCTLDLRRQTGGPDWREHQAEDRVHEPGHSFELSVFATPGSDLGFGEMRDVPVGEVMIVHQGHPVSIVGALTGRPGVVELTPDHLRGARSNGEYRRTIIAYIGATA